MHSKAATGAQGGRHPLVRRDRLWEQLSGVTQPPTHSPHRPHTHTFSTEGDTECVRGDRTPCSPGAPWGTPGRPRPAQRLCACPAWGPQSLGRLASAQGGDRTVTLLEHLARAPLQPSPSVRTAASSKAPLPQGVSRQQEQQHWKLLSDKAGIQHCAASEEEVGL